MILKVKDFSIANDFMLKVTFNNGETRLVDLSNDLTGDVFEPLKDKSFFKKAYLTEWSVIEWPNGADFAPEYLWEIGKKVL
jgi:Protein of unknown function (DUF2442)